MSHSDIVYGVEVGAVTFAICTTRENAEKVVEERQAQYPKKTYYVVPYILDGHPSLRTGGGK